jgi:hypothetical protein
MRHTGVGYFGLDPGILSSELNTREGDGNNPEA